ncbi:MAG: YggS family pyridoxal phosphate-dependent enzyme [Acidobacteriota bacterium]
MAVVDIASNLKRLEAEIKSAAHDCGRDPTDIRLMAVSKTCSGDLVSKAVAAGHTLFGENRLQEAWEKIPQVNQGGLCWHLIGPLQSNKARRAVEIFDVIQTLDRSRIARKVNQYAQEMDKILPVFIQVNIGEEPQKHGLTPREVPGMVQLVDSLSCLNLEGLMALPPHSDEPEASRPYFRRLAELLNEINLHRERPVKDLSMGMSHDYRIAIEEGATLIRVGTAIFGPRST